MRFVVLNSIFFYYLKSIYLFIETVNLHVRTVNHVKQYATLNHYFNLKKYWISHQNGRCWQ